MTAMRKDYLSDRFMIVAKKDGADPDSDSPFAPGNEHMTNPAVFALVDKEGMLQRGQDADGVSVKNWIIRVFAEGDPVVTPDAEREYAHGLHPVQPALGYHYTMVASPNRGDSFSTLSLDQWSHIIMTIQYMVKRLYHKKDVAYVAVCADHGDLVEAALPYPCIKIVTLPFIPPVVASEHASSHEMMKKGQTCSTCKTVNAESGGPRQILQTDHFIAFCPWVSASRYEFCICPKKHAVSLPITQKEIRDLALILRTTLGGLVKTVGEDSYSVVFHLSPENRTGVKLHWSVRVYPVTKSGSGMGRGFGVYLNDVSPEEAASKLGASCRKEMAIIVGID